MTQDEHWLEKYKEVKSFIGTNKRNPSIYDARERGLYCTGSGITRNSVILES